MGSPTGAAWEGGGADSSRGIAHKHRRRGGKVERSRGIAHWRSRGKVEGRRAAVGRPTGAAKEGRCVRGSGQGAGGRGEDHLCGAPLGFPPPLTHEVTHLQTCGRGGDTAIQNWLCNCAGKQVGNTSRQIIKSW